MVLHRPVELAALTGQVPAPLPRHRTKGVVKSPQCVIPPPRIDAAKALAYTCFLTCRVNLTCLASPKGLLGYCRPADAVETRELSLYAVPRGKDSVWPKPLAAAN